MGISRIFAKFLSGVWVKFFFISMRTNASRVIFLSFGSNMNCSRARRIRERRWGFEPLFTKKTDWKSNILQIQWTSRWMKKMLKIYLMLFPESFRFDSSLESLSFFLLNCFFCDNSLNVIFIFVCFHYTTSIFLFNYFLLTQSVLFCAFPVLAASRPQLITASLLLVWKSPFFYNISQTIFLLFATYDFS